MFILQIPENSSQMFWKDKEKELVHITERTRRRVGFTKNGSHWHQSSKFPPGIFWALPLAGEFPGGLKDQEFIVVVGIALSTERSSASCSHISSQVAKFHSELSKLGHKLELEKGCTNWSRLYLLSLERR